MSGNQKAQNAVRVLLRAGVQLSPDALNYLSLHPDPNQVAAKAILELGKKEVKPLVVTKRMLENLTPVNSSACHADAIALGSPSTSDENQVQRSAEVLSPLYVDCSSKGKLEDFVAYFRSRYEKLRKLFRARKDVLDAVTASEAARTNEGNKVKLVGLVTSRRDTDKGMIILELEDPTDIISVLISSSDESLHTKASRVLLDQVISVEGVVRDRKTVSGKDLNWADIPYDHKANRTKEPVHAVLASDIHYGSTKFLRDRFEEFIKWIRGEGPTEESKKAAKLVRYLVIAGDLVDGLGVYPNQEEELEVKDIYEQYAGLAEYLKKIPKTIEIIAIPGNHDATRLALPQPPVPDRYIEPLAKACTNFRMLGNPALLRIEGVEILVYHAKIIDNILSTLPEISSKTVNQALQELLRCRHMAPIWDSNNPVVPTDEDMLVLERIPDILHTGHIHINAVSQYRGVLTVNAGAFQSQTSYQRSMGVKPTPGTVVVIDLSTMRPSQIRFGSDVGQG